MSLSSVLRDLNEAKLWRRRVHVWGRNVNASSLDRLVCLLLHRAGLMGADERRLLTRLVKPGMQVVDIGANVGLYAMLLSELVGTGGRVYAFEPEPTLFRSLERNCRENGVTNVVSANCALGAAPGRVAFYRSVFNSGDNRLGSLGWQGQSLEVDMVRLDDALPQHCIDFVKMDVQGFEAQVLCGMDRVFDASPNLTVYFEFWPSGLRAAGTCPQSLPDQLAKRGFRIYRIENDELYEVDDFGSLERQAPGSKYLNLVASRRDPT